MKKVYHFNALWMWIFIGLLILTTCTPAFGQERMGQNAEQYGMSLRIEENDESGYIDVTVQMDKNAGCDNFAFDLVYDKEMFSLENVSFGTGLVQSSDRISKSEFLSQSPYHLGIVKGQKTNQTGDIATFSFARRVKLENELEYAFTVKNGECGYFDTSSGAAKEMHFALPETSITFSPGQSRLFYFDADGTVKIDENGNVVLTEMAETERIDDYAMLVRQKELNIGDTQSSYRYFAVLTEDYTYRVVKLPDTEGIKAVYAEGDMYACRLEAEKIGSYDLDFIANGKSYVYTVNSTLPNIACYGKAEMTTADLLLDEFHFNRAAESSADGGEAYFYVILRLPDGVKDTIDLSVGDVSGIAIESGERYIDKSDGKTYIRWRISVSDRFEGSENDSRSVTFRTSTFDLNGEPVEYSVDLVIYGAMEVSKETQLYAFFSDNVTVQADGKLKPSNGSELSPISKLTLEQNWKYYFAVREEDDYYVVDTVEADDKILKINSESDSPLFTLQPQKTGKGFITANRNGKTYRLSMKCSLPKLGYYSQQIPSFDTRIKSFYGAEWMKPGSTEASFYITAKKSSDSSNKPTVTIVDQASGKPFLESELLISNPIEVSVGDEAFYVYQVTVKKADFNARTRIKVEGYGGGTFYICGTGVKAGISISGTVISWNDADNAKYLLYDSTMSDADIKADLKLDTPEKALSYTATKGGVTKNADGKRYDQTFSFSQIPEGSYKLGVYKPEYPVYIFDINANEDILLNTVELYMLGDVNMDGHIKNYDATLLRKYIAGNTQLTIEQIKGPADLNRDGHIKNYDATLLRKYIAGNIVSFEN